MIIKRRLVIDVEYDITDCEDKKEAIEQIERNLDFIASHISGAGLFTQDVEEATVDSYDNRIERVEG